MQKLALCRQGKKTLGRNATRVMWMCVNAQLPPDEQHTNALHRLAPPSQIQGLHCCSDLKLAVHCLSPSPHSGDGRRKCPISIGCGPASFNASLHSLTMCNLACVQMGFVRQPTVSWPSLAFLHVDFLSPRGLNLPSKGQLNETDRRPHLTSYFHGDH